MSGSHTITVTNPAGYSGVRIVVLNGTGCNPTGGELACVNQPQTTVSAQASLTAGTTYTILVHTGGNAIPLVNPTIDITP